jgi:NitT/TauT family transport system substrate-binding protein
MRPTRARALALAGAAALFPRGARAQAPADHVRIGWTASENAAQAYYAVNQGYLAKAGIDAELFTFPNSQAISNALAGNAIDVGAADMIQLANGYLHGVPFAFFAGAAVYSSAVPTLELLVGKDAPYKTAKDLEGQTVAVIALNSISAITVEEWVRQNGADLTKIKIFELPFPAMLPAIEHATIAAALFAEPFLTSALPECRVLGKTYDVVAKQFYITSWFSSRDWLGRDPDLVRRFTRAIYDTARWSNSHHDDTATILSGLTKIPVEKLRAMNRAEFATSLDPKLMQPVLDIAYRYKAIERPVAAADLIFPVGA